MQISFKLIVKLAIRANISFLVSFKPILKPNSGIQSNLRSAFRQAALIKLSVLNFSFKTHVLYFLANVNTRSSSLYATACPSICLSVMFVHPTQRVEIFGNISMLFGTLYSGNSV